jgi:tetratricopeptide (TPR) repeat protein
MPLSLKTLPTAVLTGLIAFALAAAVLLIARGPGPQLPDRAAAVRALPSQPRPGASTDERIAAYQAIVRARPRVAAGYALLAASQLQKVRETGDAGYYARAAATIDRGLSIAPGDLGLLTERGSLALSRHDFRAGLRDGERVHRADPTLNRPYGVLVDALVELGRYDRAGRTLQEMVDRKPDLAAYTRVSYFRELQGDISGARSALRLAVSAGGAAVENVAYVQTLLGNLEFADGRLRAARDAYAQALFRFPGYAPARAGSARVDAARGRTDRAIATLRSVVARLPLPEYVIALGDVELAAGRVSAARRDYALVGAEQRLLAAGGVNTDVELALFEADHGSPARGVALARRAWRAAPSVRSADAVGWTLVRAGRAEAALPWARRALRLGSRDAMVLYHAGMTARAAGRPELARSRLRAALARNPRFSPLYAPRAQRALEGLS